MGEMRDSDWSRANLLRSDWLLLIGAIITTHTFDIDPIKADVRNFRQKYQKKFKLDKMFFEK